MGLMFFSPLIDRRWAPPILPWNLSHIVAWGSIILVSSGLLFWQPTHLSFALTTLLFTALPEEWFFRAYFMTRLDEKWRANLITSLLFAIMHGLARDWIIAALVFIPSLFYGWLYQRTRDLPLLILIHGFSNLVYMMLLSKIL